MIWEESDDSTPVSELSSVLMAICRIADWSSKQSDNVVSLMHHIDRLSSNQTHITSFVWYSPKPFIPLLLTTHNNDVLLGCSPYVCCPLTLMYSVLQCMISYSAIGTVVSIPPTKTMSTVEQKLSKNLLSLAVSLQESNGCFYRVQLKRIATKTAVFSVPLRISFTL